MYNVVMVVLVIIDWKFIIFFVERLLFLKLEILNFVRWNFLMLS